MIHLEEIANRAIEAAKHILDGNIVTALGNSAFDTRYSKTGIRNPQKEKVDFVPILFGTRIAR